MSQNQPMPTIFEENSQIQKMFRMYYPTILQSLCCLCVRDQNPASLHGRLIFIVKTDVFQPDLRITGSNLLQYFKLKTLFPEFGIVNICVFFSPEFLRCLSSDQEKIHPVLYTGLSKKST